MDDPGPLNPPEEPDLIGEASASEPAPDPRTPLPSLPVSIGDDEIRARLARAARRGDLPGYHAPAERSAGPLFTITDFGMPFESRLVARREAEAIGFQIKLKPLLPAIFIALLLLSVWPGVWFTESMLETYFPDTLITNWVWWWYMILTVPFLPWAMWAAVKKSRTSARAEAERLLEKIRTALQAD
jgi:hypothetical protein